MDHQELNRYIPLDITRAEYDPYLSYQIRAVSVNSENELHNYAFLAWHILWMSFLQKTAYFIYKLDPEWVIKHFTSSPNSRSILEMANSPYDLSEIKEKTLCDIAKHPIIGYHSNKVENMKNFISRRDHVAHCSGELDIMLDEFLVTTNKSLVYAREIQDKINPIVFKDSWLPFLDTLKDEEFSLVKDAVSEFLRQNYLSIFEIQYIFENHGVDLKDFYKNSALLHLADILRSYGIYDEVVQSKVEQVLKQKYSLSYQLRMIDEIISTDMSTSDMIIGFEDGTKQLVELKKRR